MIEETNKRRRLSKQPKTFNLILKFLEQKKDENFKSNIFSPTQDGD